LTRAFGLVNDGAVDADQLLRCAVVRLKVVVTDGPVARLAAYVAVWVVAQIGAPCVEALQAEVRGRKAQRDATVELCAAADDLRRVAFDGGAILPVALAVDVRLVVDIGFDMARIVSGPTVRHAWQLDALLRPRGEQLVALEVTQAVRVLILRPQQRPLF